MYLFFSHLLLRELSLSFADFVSAQVLLHRRVR
jgi:hypothetical protein